MPILNVKVTARKSAELTQAIGGQLLELTERILHKKRSVTAIVIDYVAHDDWLIAGEPLSVHGKNSFWFEIRITDETNSKDEKAQYIREVFAAFERLLGNLHEESYIHVHDVRAASYGYGGKTQEYRYQHA